MWKRLMKILISKNMANDKQLQKALKDAFDVCFTTSDVLGNIIATETQNDPASKGDISLKNKADNYIKWYRNTFG